MGECGLDFHYDHSPRDAQREVFAAQIALALAYDLALVIHTREAWAETFDILAAEGVPDRTVFHCFTGGPDEARRCLDLGATCPSAGIVTLPVGRPTSGTRPRCARSTACWSRPTARTWRRCRTGASRTGRPGCPPSGEAVAAAQRRAPSRRSPRRHGPTPTAVYRLA